VSERLLTDPAALLDRARALLTARVSELETRVRQGDETAWPAYLAAVSALSALVTDAAPGRHGELLSTRQMAERLGIAPKTLLRRKARGDVRPAMQAGKLIRWKGTEAIR
jgi:hypothetical protein